MCGRYKISTKAPQIMAVFDVEADHAHGVGADAARPYEPPARYNVAPTDNVPCVRVGKDGQRELVPLRWGLMPFWAKSPAEGARMINARTETLLAKRHFKEALEERRCLVVADGFYEWVKLDAKGKEKQPHLLCFEDRRLFAYAGLWSRWHGKDARGTEHVFETFTILTRQPNAIAAKVHDRMPVILDGKAELRWWLDDGATVDVAAFAKPRDLDGFTSFPVDKRVGNVKNDEPALAEPVATQASLLP